MIKLRTLLTEDYIGSVDAYGHARGILVLDATREQHPDWGLGIRNRWRYLEDCGEVSWSDDPNDEFIVAVNDFLNKRGIFPKKHTMLHSGEIVCND